MNKNEIVNHIKEFYISSRFFPTFPLVIVTCLYNYIVLKINNFDVDINKLLLYFAKMSIGFIFGMLHNNLIDYDIDKKFKPHKIGLSKKILQYILIYLEWFFYH
jgi:hypothetical protein